MSGTTDKVKGRAKVAAGAVTGDKSLENEGRIDRLAGEAKDLIAEATKSIEGYVDTAGDTAGNWLRQAQETLQSGVDKIRR
ncbi:MAG: CsbD family protein [Candidatus Nanopelagicales bacterium]